jgi:dienelactone hydrolase
MMNLLLVTDIFGKTRALENLAKNLSSLYENVHIIDPYKGIDRKFKDEEEAYVYFSKNVGLENYKKILDASLCKIQDEQISLVGFSVGASAIWLLSEKTYFQKLKKVTCFYSSQIRHFLDISPNSQVTFYFPSFEKHFDVDSVIKVLSKNKNIVCKKTKFLHGFMNECSKNYDLRAYNEYIQVL